MGAFGEVKIHNFVKKIWGLWVRAMLKMMVLTALHTFHVTSGMWVSSRPFCDHVDAKTLSIYQFLLMYFGNSSNSTTQRRINVEKALKKVRNFDVRRKSVEILTFDVHSLSIFQRFFLSVSKNVEKALKIDVDSTSKMWLCPLGGVGWRVVTITLSLRQICSYIF